VKQILISIDQLANALAGGNADSSISGCAEFNASKSKFWRVMRNIINYVFEPIDGDNHCFQSLVADPCEGYVEGGIVRKFTIGVFVVLFTVLAVLPIKLIGVFK